MQCHYKWNNVCISAIYKRLILLTVWKICAIYDAIAHWDKKSRSGWHNQYGVNARTAAEKVVMDEWVRSSDVSHFELNKCLILLIAHIIMLRKHHLNHSQ